MRAPPAFEITLQDAPAWRVAQAALWALAGAGLGAWVAAAGVQWLGIAPDGAQGWAAGAAALAAALAGSAGWWLGRPVQAQVRWSGQRFELLEGGAWQPASLRAMLDLGGALLLRVQPVGGPARWIGLSGRGRVEAPGHLLRAALYCAPCVDPGRADEDRARS